MNWNKFEEGKTIGQKGSEDGTSLEDIENIQGARITMERDGNIAHILLLSAFTDSCSIHIFPVLLKRLKNILNLQN